ncbi:uncharacterized protein [Solanum lycopersicum]|uniref:uncharacterized protein n=1 Tax=Solanum lycopersicum TaxID=4081 RepID=UPI000532FAFE|nr:uncharacterized protein LOC104648675 [Solanum lycopersicum]
MPLSCFASQVLLTGLCRSKLADHPCFTRSKGPKDSFPRPNSYKGNTVMGDNNDEVSLTNVVVAHPTVAEQNELIAQRMQQIAEMRVEMQQRQDTPPPGFGPNFVDARPPISTPPKRTTFQVPIPSEHEVHGSELDHYEEQEREWKAREEAKIDTKEEIKRSMKELQCVLDVAELSYAELCIHPDLNLPEGFKIPKFDTFGGVGNPKAHLRAYCDQLVGVGKDETLLMRLFSRSLCGEALEWIVPNQYSLEKIKQKSTESYRKFAYRWRKEAARVRPSMIEKEIIEVFVRVQEPEYYDRIILLIGAKFAEIVKVGETIEDILKSGKIARVSASPGSFGLMRKKREEVAAVFYGGRKTPRNSSCPQDCSNPPPKSHQTYRPQSNHSNNYNTAPIYPDAQILSIMLPIVPMYNYRAPSHTYQVQAPAYQNPLPNYQAPVPNYQTNPYPRTQAPRPNARNYQQVPPPQQSGYDPSCPRFEKRPLRNFTALAESRTKLFERLSAAGYIHSVGPKPMDVNSKFYKPEQRCAYHCNSVGLDTEECINFKHKIQDLIDQEVVSLQPATPNVNTNPLPNHGAGKINMIKTDEDECEIKRITPVAQEDLEKAAASLSVKEKREFVILTPTKDVALVP